MGVRRPIATGEVDSLHRPIKVSHRAVESRATAPAPPETVEPVNVLQPFRPVGFERRVHQPAPDVPPQPGGTCWHCGAAIANCVIIRHVDTGETVTVGVRCAERVGLTAAQVSAMLAEFYNDQRAQQSAAQRAIWDAERDRREQARLGRVRDAASRHGTVESFEHRGCRCDACLAAVDTCEATVLVEVDSGRPIVDARMVNTRFGTRWVIDGVAGGAVWLPFAPARRQTLAGKGFVEVAATFRRLRSRRGDWFPDRHGGVLRLSEVDAWDAPVVGAAEFNAANSTEVSELPDWLEPDQRLSLAD